MDISLVITPANITEMPHMEVVKINMSAMFGFAALWVLKFIVWVYQSFHPFNKSRNHTAFQHGK